MTDAHLATEGRCCGENVSWHSLRRCGKPAAWVIRDRSSTKYRCEEHAKRHFKLGVIVRGLHVH